MTVSPPLSLDQQTRIISLAFVVLIVLGLVALIGVAAGLIWLILQAVMLMLISTIEIGGIIANLYQSADPMIRFLLLIAVGYVVYRVVHHLVFAKRLRAGQAVGGY